MGDCWHIPETGGHPAVAGVPPGLYCEDRATLDLLLADPAIEHATVTRGAPSPLLHGMRVYVATPAQLALLRAVPANRPPPPELEQDWAAVRARAETFLREHAVDLDDDPEAWPSLRGVKLRRAGMGDLLGHMSNAATAEQVKSILMEMPSIARAVRVPPGLNRAARRRELARTRRS